MFGQFVRDAGHSGAAAVVFEAFMENDGEYVLTANIDGVETSRVVLAEGFAFALANLFEREASLEELRSKLRA